MSFSYSDENRHTINALKNGISKCIQRWVNLVSSGEDLPLFLSWIFRKIPANQSTGLNKLFDDLSKEGITIMVKNGEYNFHIKSQGEKDISSLSKAIEVLYNKNLLDQEVYNNAKQILASKFSQPNKNSPTV